MAHFYSGISGARGPATRQGSRGSGIQGYVQGWQSRLSVRMWYDERNDKDTGTISIGTGPSNYSGGSLSIGLDNLDAVVDALGGNDPKIKAITARIHAEFKKLDAEAPAALKRIERKRKIEAKRLERERKETEARLVTIRESITPEERENYRRVVLELDPSDEHSLFNDDNRVDEYIIQPYGQIEPYRNDDGHLIVTSGGGWHSEKYDITAGHKIEKEQMV